MSDILALFVDIVFGVVHYIHGKHIMIYCVCFWRYSEMQQISKLTHLWKIWKSSWNCATVMLKKCSLGISLHSIVYVTVSCHLLNAQPLSLVRYCTFLSGCSRYLCHIYVQTYFCALRIKWWWWRW